MTRARISDIITLASNLSGVSVADIKGIRRHQPLVNLRAAVALVARRHGHSFPEIGRVLGRDHSTIINACQRAERYQYLTPQLNDFIELLASQAENCEPFMQARRREGLAMTLAIEALPKPVPVKVPLFAAGANNPVRSVKPKNDFGPGKFGSDSGHEFQDSMVTGSTLLAAALTAALAERAA